MSYSAGGGGTSSTAKAGNDVLVGDRGKDQLYGGYGDDVLDGGRGTDILDGGAGFNTYVFEHNSGDDRILRGSGSGVLRFGAGIAARDLSFKRRNNDLVVKVNGDGRIRIEGWFDANASHQVAGAEFADGTVMTADKFVAKGYDYEPERDEDDDSDVSNYGDDDSAGRPHGASNHEDHDDAHAKKTAPDHGKNSDRSDNDWFGKVVEKWDARSSHSAKQNAERDDARSSYVARRAARQSLAAHARPALRTPGGRAGRCRQQRRRSRLAQTRFCAWGIVYAIRLHRLRRRRREG